MKTSLPFLVLICVSRSSSENNTQVEVSNDTQRIDLSTLEEALTALNDLTTAQRQVWKQQETHRDQMRRRYNEFHTRDEARSRELEAEQNLLRDIRGRISRRLKALEKLITSNGLQSCKSQSNAMSDNPPKDCAAIYLDGDETSGVYRVWPTWNKLKDGFLVYCDMDTDGGGWTVIHRWEDIDLSKDYFQRSWADYTDGFGDLATSFWIGTQKMHELTNQGSYELRFDMKEDATRTSSVYRSFRVDDRSQEYTAHVEGYDPTGSGGDIFKFSMRANFSTFNRNNLPIVTIRNPEYRGWFGKEFTDLSPPVCATEKTRGWWFHISCDLDPSLEISVTPKSRIEMKIRPVRFSRMFNYPVKSSLGRHY